ncbi:hypothetical protein OHT20_15950 [Streptomyces caniferus]|uniref:Uncharacterized protein n=1 Tax=Streptomyces caniferus TaxID=285557 RepID=A0A640S6T1_9ACTN|nr:hypothetical protein [Streptomyces caniferus]GFE05335.1 hypothetical protein Scani_16030 [Streptomyces caniferus]
MPHEDPRYLLVQARSEPSPLYEPYGGGTHEDLETFTAGVPLDDLALGLPEDLAHALRSWSLSRPPGGFTARPDLRAHVKQGLVAARRLAGHLGPPWAVRYWDERHRTAKWVCWGCERLHWEHDSHGIPPHPVDLIVEGEFRFGPLRSDGFGDFFPDDPAAALDLSDGLVAALYGWADEIDTTLNLEIRDREEGKYDDTWQRLFHEGRDLARRVAHELGPAWTVTYKGLVNGGLAAMTYVEWQGDRELPA